MLPFLFVFACVFFETPAPNSHDRLEAFPPVKMAGIATAAITWLKTRPCWGWSRDRPADPSGALLLLAQNQPKTKRPKGGWT